MAGRYDRQIATAKRLIAKYGELCTVTVQGADMPDPAKPWIIIPGVPVVYQDVSIAFLPINKEQRESLIYRKGEEVAKSSTIGYMGVVLFEVDLTIIVTRKSGQQLFLNDIQDLNPNGDKILFTLVFKQ